MKITHICFVIIILAPAVITESIRCRRLCAFTQRPINGSIPLDGCTAINKNNSQCSVYVEINQQKLNTLGRLGIQGCTNDYQRQVNTIVKFNSSFSIIRYACMTDDCDVDFLDQQFPLLDDFSHINAALIEQSVTNLIFDSNSNASDIDCGKNVFCPAGELCQATFEFETNSTSVNIPDTYDASVSCFKTSKDYYFVNITQIYSSTDAATTEMTIRCNIPNCASAQIANNIYSRISINRIILTNPFESLNDTNTCSQTGSTGTSLLLSSYGFIIFPIVVLLFS